jgi:hypothetical protein
MSETPQKCARGAPRDARTISIFREACHILEAIKAPSQYFLDRLYEAVRRPARELVERHELISFSQRMRLTF